MNALQRDLKKLVPLVESLGKADVEADPYRQQFHLQPPVGWLNDPNGGCRWNFWDGVGFHGLCHLLRSVTYC